MLMQWGQFVDHDITHTPTVRGEDETGIQCCSDDGETLAKRDRHRACFPIDIPDNDRMFSKVTDFHLKQCISRFFFPVWPEMYGVCEVYASTQVPWSKSLFNYQVHYREGCNFGPREQINQITAWIDGSNVYGRYNIHTIR